MAVRKHDFDEQDERDTTDTLTLNVSRKLRRRIERLAAQHHLSVSEYLEPILRDTLPEEGDETQQRHPATRKMLEELRQVQDNLMRERNGKLFDGSVEMLHQIREEHSQELEKL